MTDQTLDVASAETPTTNQRLFVRYLTAILIDLLVLNLFVEFWQHVVIDSFSVSLLAAILLQVLLKLTLSLEHGVAGYFTSRTGALWRFLRIFSAWLSIGILTGIFRQRVEYRNSADYLLLREQSKQHCW